MLNQGPGGARRAEIVSACEAELHNSSGLHDLARYVLEYLDDIVDLLEHRSDDRAETESARHLQVIGQSAAAFRSRIELEQLVYRPRASVLISGERGTGRRHFARMLHFATCAEGALLELDESNLWQLDGWRADSSESSPRPGGTVYVHELGEAALTVQLAVAHLLDECPPGVRVIATSSPAFATLARRSTVPEAMAFHFQAELQLQPLRARLEDVPLLAGHFAERIRSRIPGASLRFNSAALDLLQSYRWPGNVAELARLVRGIWNQSVPGTSGPKLPAASTRAPVSGTAVLMQLRQQLVGTLRA